MASRFSSVTTAAQFWPPAEATNRKGKRNVSRRETVPGGRERESGQMRGRALLALLTAAVAFGIFAASAAAGGIVVDFTKNGINDDRTCESFQNDPDLTPGPGQQGWLFI